MKKVWIGRRRKVQVPLFLRFLFPVKEKQISLFYKLYEKNDFLYVLFQCLPVLTVINWISQGLPAMSRTEKVFHLLFGLFLYLLLSILFPLSPWCCFLIAHTVNWLMNSHFWAFVRFWNIRFNTSENYYKYLSSLAKRLQGNEAFLVVVVIGGLALDKSLTAQSDLDVKFIAKEGIVNGFRANLFLLREKLRAFFLRIPFDANLYCTMAYFKSINQSEMPYILYRDSSLSDSAILKYKMRDLDHV
jgi:hypothetical protein